MTDIKKVRKYTSELTVLYAEDEIAVQQELKSIFELLFAKVITANNGQEALELYEEHGSEIDLIISDVRMPKMDGLEMVGKIREHDINVPVILITAFSEQEYFIKSIGLKVDKYLLKPIQKDSLIDTIYNIAESISQKKLLAKLIEEKRESELKQKEKNTMLMFTEAFSLPMVIFSEDKVVHYSQAFKNLFEDKSDDELKNISFEMDGLFDKQKGFLKSFVDFNPKNYEFNKVQITTQNSKKIFRVYEKDVSYFEKDAQMFIFVNITYEEYLKVKSNTYMESLEKMVVREKVNNASIVATTNEKVVDKTQNMLRKRHKDEEINAVDFLATINPIYITDLQELDDLDKDLADAIFELEDGVAEKLQEVAKFFYIYADNIYFLEDFRDIYVVIKNLVKILEVLDYNDIADDKRVTFILYLNSIREDLAYWRKSIFIDQATPNIHYLDSSLLSSCLQVESLLSSEEEAEDDFSDLEFF